MILVTKASELRVYHDVAKRCTLSLGLNADSLLLCTTGRLTRNWGIHAKQEEVEVDLRELAVKNIARPLRILFTEPIVLLVTIYMSFLYGILVRPYALLL